MHESLPDVLVFFFTLLCLLLTRCRERKQAELELQNARRKETREMARDLESQLASVDRTSNVRAPPTSSTAMRIPGSCDVPNTICI